MEIIVNHFNLIIMDRLYIIDPNNFKGTVLNTMPFVDTKTRHGADILQHTHVDYNGGTFAEYNAKHGGNLVALTWDEFEEQYYKPHLKSLQGPWEVTTEERFWDGLECLPPKKWTQFPGGEYFFVGECYTADLYTCYVRKGDEYYTALRSIHTSPEDLINLVNI
jgi:hypothetical protein